MCKPFVFQEVLRAKDASAHLGLITERQHAEKGGRARGPLCYLRSQPHPAISVLGPTTGTF